MVQKACSLHHSYPCWTLLHNRKESMVEMQHAWKPTLEADARERTMQVVLTLAERLASYPASREAPHALGTCSWQDTSLAAGFPSLALFFWSLARGTQERHWQEIARGYLTLAGKATKVSPLQTPGLAKGTSGLATVLACFCQNEPRFQSASLHLTGQLAQQVLHTTWTTRVGEQDILQFDVIRGAAGVLGYLVREPAPNTMVQDAIALLLHLLVAFAIDPAQWLLPVSLFPAQQQRYHETSLVNCGFAHGLPGPLAALALAKLAGYSIDGQQEAIQRLACWLTERHIATEWGIDWPAVIPAHTSLEAIQRLAPARSGWCYGAPGLVRALWLASQALEDTTLQALALQGMHSVLRRPVHTRQIDALTLCHGTAGLLLITLRFFHETADPLIGQHIPVLVHQIIQEFQPALPFGFRFAFPETQSLDTLGLFLGVTGTLLALLAASTEVEPHWDRALLLS